MTGTPRLPDGFGITLDASAKQLRDGLWFGGMPPRVLRLTAPGVRAWAQLRAGPVASPGAGALARRFTDAGLAHPLPPVVGDVDVTVVVPVRDRAAELDRCLTALGHAHPVVVVDDASLDPSAVADVAARHGAKLVRREVNGGPGAARNSGLDVTRSELVAFLDSDTIAGDGWVERVAGHFADPLVAAVAPRITAEAGDTWAGRHTRARGSLDLGSQSARVAPLTRVSYVPTAALVVRRSAMPRFDESLRVGEDVDLVWRLNDAGWRVRYDPSVEVPHREPESWRGLLRRRFTYGTSAAPLAVRHPASFAPLVLHTWPSTAAVALLCRRPLPAALATAAGVATLARTLRRADVPTDGLVPAVAASVGQSVLGISRYLTQLAAPALVAALIPRHTRWSAAALLLAAPLDAWRRDPHALDAPRYVAGTLADEIAYGAGVWAGCLRHRTLAPVRPSVIRRPVRVETRSASTPSARS